MPKISFGGNKDLAKASLGDVEAYDEALLGVPPKGIYRVRVKRLTMKKNKNNDWMLNAVAEIAELATSPKAKYNAYGTWFNLNVTEKGAKGINNFLDSISGGSQAVKDDFWSKGVKVSDDKLKPAVVAIGRLQIKSEGMYGHALMRNGTDQSGGKRLEIDRFLMRNGAPEEADIDDTDDDEIVVVDADAVDGYDTGEAIEHATDAGDDYDDEPDYVEEAPEPPEETGADVVEADATDEPPF